MFQLENIVPEPLQGQTAASGVWGKSVVLEYGQNHLVRAPSGKGKSTFLHLLFGLRQDFTGELSWLGAPTRKFTPDQWADLRRESVSIVFQDLRLFPHLTAWENLCLKNDLTQFFPPEKLRAYAERLGMAPYLEQRADTLSYGQRQRIAIVRALAQPFRYLLLDEPFSHLDEDNARTAKSLIDEALDEQGACLILASLGDDYGWNFQNKLIL